MNDTNITDLNLEDTALKGAVTIPTLEPTTQRTITRIPATPISIAKRTRAAGYARVSCAKDAMLESLAAQVSYYSAYIQRNPEYEYVGVYADEAVTGTKDNRPEFQRLLADCREGKIDLILTKSISRFARNTVTLLNTVRELKTIGIDVFFERENLHSISGDGELMLSILASYAQEESLSVSENTKWRIRNDFKQGYITSLQVYGYRFISGELIIHPDEAAVVRMIFDDFLSGMGKNAIMKKLRDMNVPTRLGGKWSEVVIHGILTNERYIGDLLLQKTHVENHITKRSLPNRNFLPKYYVRDTHEPIISREMFDAVQIQIKHRATSPTAYIPPYTYPFAGKIICGNCGKPYHRIITSGKVAWNCGTFVRQGKAFCHAKKIPEDILIRETVAALDIQTFDQSLFNRKIHHIEVPAFNTLVFIFLDGNRMIRKWVDPSRSDSWTDEMRAAVGAKTKARHDKAQHDKARKGDVIIEQPGVVTLNKANTASKEAEK